MTASGPWGKVPRAVVEDSALELGPLRLFCALACFADGETKEAFPAQDTLAEILDVSRPTVSKWAEVLEARGLLRIESRMRARGGRNRHRYVLYPFGPDETSQEEAVTSSEVEVLPPTKALPNGGLHRDERRAEGSVPSDESDLSQFFTGTDHSSDHSLQTTSNAHEISIRDQEHKAGIHNEGAKGWPDCRTCHEEAEAEKRKRGPAEGLATAVDRVREGVE